MALNAKRKYHASFECYRNCEMPDLIAHIGIKRSIASRFIVSKVQLSRMRFFLCKAPRNNVAKRFCVLVALLSVKLTEPKIRNTSQDLEASSTQQSSQSGNTVGTEALQERGCTLRRGPIISSPGIVFLPNDS